MAATDSTSIGFKDISLIQSLPAIQQRVRALKKLQFKRLAVRAKMAEEVFELNQKYQSEFEPIVEKMSDIIRGTHEPTDEECDVDLDLDEQSLGQSPYLIKKLQQIKCKSIEGIAGFWLKAMLKVDEINDWIENHDIPVLMELIDIKVTRSSNPSKISLKFEFKPNDFFTNKELTKEYEISFGLNPQKPWDLEEWEVISRKGCQIDWKVGKNVTQMARKVAKSKNQSKNKTEFRKIDSFFDFFNPPEEPPMSDDMEDQLEDDWVLGQFLILHFVPNAVLYYSGDLFEDHTPEESSDSDSFSTESSDAEEKK